MSKSTAGADNDNDRGDGEGGLDSKMPVDVPDRNVGDGGASSAGDKGSGGSWDISSSGSISASSSSSSSSSSGSDRGDGGGRGSGDGEAGLCSERGVDAADQVDDADDGVARRRGQPKRCTGRPTLPTGEAVRLGQRQENTLNEVDRPNEYVQGLRSKWEVVERVGDEAC